MFILSSSQGQTMKQQLIGEKSFANGFFYPFRGAKFVMRHPRLYGYILIPFLINALVFSTALYLGYQFFNGFVLEHIPQGEQWYWAILYYLAWFVAAIGTSVLMFFSFAIIGNLIASPFNDLLSEKVEIILGGSEIEAGSWREMFSDSWRIIKEEAKRMIAFVVLMILLIPINFIPGFGQVVYTVLSSLLLIFFLTVEYFSYPLYRKTFTFKEQRKYIFSHKLLSFGFGCGVFCLLAIPLLQLLTIPLSVVGATMLCVTFPPVQKELKGVKDIKGIQENSDVEDC
jgi:CysZ protein